MDRGYEVLRELCGPFRLAVLAARAADMPDLIEAQMASRVTTTPLAPADAYCPHTPLAPADDELSRTGAPTRADAEGLARLQPPSAHRPHAPRDLSGAHRVPLTPSTHKAPASL
ncbi:hypothetical protein Aglo03_18430 [Actinokineospora globicatena]|uniref:Uncharacterized protein n=1 Tax=Actinokineospora globicatena TaxID=103729 RepID=A0A9W6QM04_9PSEU|nr:hypothetical protein Aglo03_18430 [Actinokineospora globicatena]